MTERILRRIGAYGARFRGRVAESKHVQGHQAGQPSVGGDISPETPASPTGRQARLVIDRTTFEARSDAQQIRDGARRGRGDQAQALEKPSEIKRQAYKKRTTRARRGRNQGAQRARRRSWPQRASGSMQIEAQAVPQLRDLAVTIARKILGRELEFTPRRSSTSSSRRSSEKARQRREIVLRVNPDDLAVVRERRPELLEVLCRAKEIGIREDPDVARYGVIIETDAGIIDAQLETQLEVFERVLKETR